MPLIDYGRIAARASLIRQRCGFFDSEPPYSTTKITELCFRDLEVTGVKLPPGVLEMVQAGLGRRVLYYNRSASQAEQRVGIAHGLHHLLTDLREPSDTDVRECNVGLRRLERDGVLPQSPIETACDLFAAEILTPFNKLDEYAPDELFPADVRRQDAFDDECDRLASRFNVPRWFLDWRLADLAALRATSLNLR